MALTLVVVTMANVAAQEEETLFKKGENGSNLGFVFATGLNVSPMVESTGAIFHMRTGLAVNKNFAFGGFYQATLNDLEPLGEQPGIYMDYRAAGAYLEYTVQPTKLVHVSFPLLIGMAEVEMDNEAGSAGFGEENFFVIEPGANLEINLHKNLRLNAGAAYRITGDLAYRNVDTSDVQGFVGSIGLKLVLP